jgi:hypothetical protein
MLARLEFEERHAADADCKTAQMQREMREHHAELTAQHQSALALLKQTHEDKVQQARAHAAKEIAEIEAECRQRLDELLLQVEEEEASIHGRHAAMLEAAQGEVVAKLDEVALECNRKVQLQETDCQARLQKLLESVEAEEAKLAACKTELLRERQEAEKEREAVLSRATEDMEAHLAAQLDQELARLREHHERLLARRREHEERRHNASIQEMYKHFAELEAAERSKAEAEFGEFQKARAAAFEQERVRLVQEFEKESAKIREELTLTDALALDNLRHELTEERRRASLSVMDQCVKAAETVRRKTEVILRQELRKEIESVAAAHAKERANKLTAIGKHHALDLQELEREMGQAHQDSMRELRVQMQEAADAELARVRERLASEADRKLAELREASDAALGLERERIDRDLLLQRKRMDSELEARHAKALGEADAALQLCENEWAEELELALSDLRARLAHKALSHTASLACELRKIAEVPTDALAKDFDQAYILTSTLYTDVM